MRARNRGVDKKVMMSGMIRDPQGEMNVYFKLEAAEHNT